MSANIVNHPRFQKLHNSYGASIPFAPDHTPINYTREWRISSLPSSRVKEVLSMDVWPHPPEYKHRWLPMKEAILDDCPMRSGLDCWGQPQWQCATIAHYSLFWHLETRPYPRLSRLMIGDEHIYDFGIWDINGGIGKILYSPSL